MQRNSKFRQKFKIFFYLILNEFSNKFNNNFLKKISDIIFIFSEKITLKLDYFLKYYISYYNDIIDKEIILASISKTDSIIHIGCGSIPASSILIAQKKNSKIICIDKDIKAVKNAEFCVKKLGLNEKIQIKQSEAVDFDFNKFDVILISQGITLNEIFLKNLSNIPKNTRIIFRTFSSETGDLDESDIILENIFNIKQIIKHEKHGKVISIMLTVK